MSRLPALTPAKIIRALERAGFEFVRQRGSHKLFQKDNHAIIIPFHNKDLRKGTLRHIIKQSGFTLDEFLKFL